MLTALIPSCNARNETPSSKASNARFDLNVRRFRECLYLRIFSGDHKQSYRWPRNTVDRRSIITSNLRRDVSPI
ncbi:hypothetical protein NL676_009860 [Syzygium grande]|nr:hypothetical protein NL676_009860 [Syzygium grande]